MLDINISIYIHIYMECSDASSAIVCLRVRCMCCLLVHASKTDTQASINVVSSSNGCHDNVHHFEHPRSVFVQDIPLCITAEVYIRHILRRDVHSLADIRFRPEYTPLYISMHTLSIINIIIIIVFFFFFLVAVVAFCTVCVSGTDSLFKYMCNLKCNASILRYINIFFSFYLSSHYSPNEVSGKQRRAKQGMPPALDDSSAHHSAYSLWDILCMYMYIYIWCTFAQ